MIEINFCGQDTGMVTIQLSSSVKSWALLHDSELHSRIFPLTGAPLKVAARIWDSLCCNRSLVIANMLKFEILTDLIDWMCTYKPLDINTEQVSD